ncbi:MAG TPA: hypothetical protein P5205_03840 [Candidatus Paceibacterota bacterium]|nr:hypothetical protein [Verrucomicrobiota bacterium]HSA09481.1 hypothetical protein [Candidatus Paceibacterota bacterium]
MLGREELDKLAAQKQALLVESSLNRLAWQADFQHLRSATVWMKAASGGVGKASPLLLLLAPLAGFLLARRSRPSGSWLSRALATLRWIAPLYGVWKRYSAASRKAES